MYSDKHQKLHSAAFLNNQLNNIADEEDIEKRLELIQNNISDVFYSSEMTMNEFAMTIDVSRTTISRAVNYNLKVVTLNLLLKISTYMNCSLEALVSELSEEEIKVAKLYRELPEEKKQIVQTLISLCLNENNEKES